MAPALLFLLPGLAWRRAASGARLVGGAAPRACRSTSAAAAVLGGRLSPARGRPRRRAQGGAAPGIFELENPLAPLPAARARGQRLRDLLPVPRAHGASRCASRRTSRPGRSASLRPARRRCLGGAAPARRAARRGAPRGCRRARRRRRSASSFCASRRCRRRTCSFPTGTIFAERLAYLPSAGFCLIAAVWIARRRARISRPCRAGAWRCSRPSRSRFAARTVVRNPVWASDEALFTNMVRVSPASAKAHYDFAYMSAEIGPTAPRARALRARHRDLSRATGTPGPGTGRDGADARATRRRPRRPTPSPCAWRRPTRTATSALGLAREDAADRGRRRGRLPRGPRGTIRSRSRSPTGWRSC